MELHYRPAGCSLSRRAENGPARHGWTGRDEGRHVFALWQFSYMSPWLVRMQAPRSNDDMQSDFSCSALLGTRMRTYYGVLFQLLSVAPFVPFVGHD